MNDFNLNEFVKLQYWKKIIDVIREFDKAIYEIEWSKKRLFDATEILDSLKVFLTIFRMPWWASVSGVTWKSRHYDLFWLLIKDLYERWELDDTFLIIINKLKWNNI